MALLCLLAIVMCGLVPRLQSRRLNLGIAHKVQSSGHSDDADMTAFSYGEELLTCQVGPRRFVIQAKDKAFWDYVDAKIDFLTGRSFQLRPSSISCKTYTPPTKPSSSLRNLMVPEDMIGLIASFNDEAVHCSPCVLMDFNMTFLEKCSTPSTAEQTFKIHKEVMEEGSSCRFRMISADEQTLQMCMASPKDLSGSSQYPLQSMRGVPICNFASDQSNMKFIKETEGKLKENDETIQKRQAFIKEQQELLNENKDTSLGLQKVIDARKQDVVYLKQMFEGP